MKRHLASYLMGLALVTCVAWTAYGGTYAYTTIDFPGATETWVYGINDSGIIVGWYRGAPTLDFHGFIYEGGTFIAIDVPSDLPFNGVAGTTGAYMINNLGDIVGSYMMRWSGYVDFLYRDGGFSLVTYHSPLVGYPHASGINDSGTLVGEYGTDWIGPHTFVGAGTDFSTIAFPGAFTDTWGGNDTRATYAYGINNSGDIVGEYCDADGYYHGFLCAADDPTTQEGIWTICYGSTIDFPGSSVTEVYGINDSGTIVGRHGTSGVAASHGFVYDGATFIPVDVPGFYYTYTYPRGINSSGQVVGYYLDNNSKSHGFLATPVAADLKEISVNNPPATALVGGRFSVTDTVKNQGNASDVASSTRYYFSSDTIKNNGDILLAGTRSVPALAVGATSSGTVNVTIPSGTAAGSYYLLACADDTGVVMESNEGNNCIASGTTVQVSGPDLIETSVSNPLATALLGSRLSVTDTVKNQGNSNAGNSSTRYYLSLDTVKGAGDVLLTGSRPVAALAPGAISTGTVNALIPSSAPVGTYYLLACADDTGVVAESNEGNNCIASSTTVQVITVDLIETSVSSPPATASLGSSFPVTDTVMNQGSSNAGASTTRYYLSVDTVKGAGDLLLTGSRSVPALGPGTTSTGTVNVVIPSTAAAGTYSLLACADEMKVVAESNENNNCIASSTTVVVTVVDLIETSVGNPLATASLGSSFSVTDTVMNQGSSNAGASTTRYYLSVDTVKSTTDKLLTGSRGVPALGPGVTSTGTVSVTIATSTVVGTYYLLACADDMRVVAESNENNNCIASGTTVQVQAPDLIETAVSNPPTTAKVGSSFSVTDTVQNQGTAGAGTSATRYYLSTDALKSSDDKLLTGSRAVPALGAGITSTGTVNVTIPPTTVAGTYYLLACADDGRAVAESNEANNCIASSSTVQVTP